MIRLKVFSLIICAAVIFLTGCGEEKNFGTQELLNVSCEPTREFYAAYNERFKIHWENELRKGTVILNQSHGASGSQARAVIDGLLEADVVTLSISYDVTTIRNAGLIRGGWRIEFPDNSSPYTSTIVFLVRKDNPKNIRDWDDLIREDIKIVTPNPKTSGGARWNYLAAWEFADRKFYGDKKRIKDFMRRIFANVVSLDAEVRSAKESFQSGKGDVLIAWESEALEFWHEFPESYEIVTPSLSIVAEMTVAIVDSVVEKKGTRELAKEYLNYLYSTEGQELAAQNYYRPRDKDILKKYSSVFKKLELFTIDEAFGGWVKAHREHFADGAIFDQIYKNPIEKF
ncbi:MAG: sulfate ABC transporter substrate-binding protein [Selenomonadaceae bacterium]|nr:sulfate ABC transporter substrate-binding protein [Selenomonadaceae bacterium]